MSAIDVDVDDAGLHSLFAGIFARVADVAPAWPGVADAFADQERILFATEGASSGTPWEPLSPPYAAWKAAVRPGLPTLIFDGPLIDSLTTRPLGIEEYHADHAIFGTDDHTAQYHQRGTEKMPARPPVFAGEILAKETARLLADWITDGTA